MQTLQEISNDINFNYEKLFPYQKNDVERLIAEDRNFLNNSDRGTGKTPVAIGYACLGGFQDILILCSKTLKYEWEDQIKSWTGHKPTISKRGCYKRLEPLFFNNESPFFILNYETFRTRRHLDVLNKYPWDLIILDEPHRLRNPKTKMTKGVFEFLEARIESPTNFKLLLMTGSPIVNNPADLHTLLCMADHTVWSLKGRHEFIHEFCYYKKTRNGYKVTGVRDMQRLREITAPYTIRNSKKDPEIAKYFTEKYAHKSVLKMSPKQRKYYDAIERGMFVLLDSGEPLHAPGVLAALMRLRQINLDPRLIGITAPSSKTAWVLEQAEEFMASDSKLVLFSCFETYISLLAEEFTRKKIPFLKITGKERDDTRISIANDFQNSKTPLVIMGTMGPIPVMSEGITLHAASDVILTDIWWNPSVNDQAIDRLHRIGQVNAVQILRPVNEFSSDSSMDLIVERKAALSDAYSGESSSMQELITDLRENYRKRPIDLDELDDNDDEEEDD